jgi:hypothetical protein
MCITKGTPIPLYWQKEFDADIRFWLKFNADWYESVILSKEHMTVDMMTDRYGEPERGE